ncbi:MFS transporter [Bordetella genomosp. 9]|uniref:MFS transporter n=1 Tax=Bordetella genomosp. 9 TaxID=1416803 RepID=A0A1W6Z240_9BORD|nr:MFS transporter [Bordetella genomosp. 9]ARP87435.1 MFS transporter [Bordetella genomosp. 9]
MSDSVAAAEPGAVEAAPPAGTLVPALFFALGTFAIGTEGFMIAPLLPKMAADLGMGVPAAASLVIVFTLALAISSPLTTLLSGRFNRRDTLAAAMAAFTLANIVAAFSSGFGVLLAARLMMAVAAGLYVPNATALAGAIAGPARRGRALAIVSGGVTIAIALGLPFGALVGHAFGWRSTFLAVAAMGIVACAGVVLGVSRQAGKELPVASLTQRVGVIGQAAVRRLLAVTLFWAIGAYAVYPFIAPYLTGVLGYGEAGIGATVSLWGVSAAIGVMSGGAFADRFGARRVVAVTLILLALSFWALALAGAGLPRAAASVLVPVAIVVWGVSVWGFFPAQMARLIAAGAPAQAPVALSLNTSTMYLGFSAGSAAGAGILQTGTLWGIGLFGGLAVLAAIAADRRI